MLRGQTKNLSSGIVSGGPSALGEPAVGDPSSASISLACEYLTNPFGSAEQARELLSQIEGRSVYDAELERGEFCFQIAFYFLACLAIAAHVDDPLLQKSCINRLYDRVRAFYARTDLKVKFSDFIVMAVERDQFVTGLRGGDICRVVITKLGLFDLVGMRRLYEYHDVIGLPNSDLRFYIVAVQLLLHYGGKSYHPAVVAVIADLISGKYNILSKVVLSNLCRTNTRDPEFEEPIYSLPLDPNMPDIINKRPNKIYLAGDYLLLLVENVGPIGAKGAVRFRYVLVVCNGRTKLPECFVTLENSTSISNVLCVFEANGSHSN